MCTMTTVVCALLAISCTTGNANHMLVLALMALLSPKVHGYNTITVASAKKASACQTKCIQCVYLKTFSSAFDASPCQALTRVSRPLTGRMAVSTRQLRLRKMRQPTGRVVHADTCTDAEWQKRALTAVQDRLCGAGMCANGKLIALKKRTQANHCGTCNLVTI